MSLTLTRRAAALVALALALASLAMTAGPAHAAKPRYTNATNVARDCPIHWNYPKAGVSPDSTWPAGPSTTTQRVGVRYTINNYALVLDYSRAEAFPHWGWIDRSCLVDGVARQFPEGVTDVSDRPDENARALGEAEAVGGDNSIRTVDISAPHNGGTRATIHLGTGGTLRSGPKKFATGNLDASWEFRINRDRCRTLDGGAFNPDQWVLGYSPNADRWGYVQARHLPACTA